MQIFNKMMLSIVSSTSATFWGTACSHTVENDLNLSHDPPLKPGYDAINSVRYAGRSTISTKQSI